jgi:hypothetical protein
LEQPRVKVLHQGQQGRKLGNASGQAHCCVAP